MSTVILLGAATCRVSKMRATSGPAPTKSSHLRWPGSFLSPRLPRGRLWKVSTAPMMRPRSSNRGEAQIFTGTTERPPWRMNTASVLGCSSPDSMARRTGQYSSHRVDLSTWEQATPRARPRSTPQMRSAARLK